MNKENIKEGMKVRISHNLDKTRSKFGAPKEMKMIRRKIYKV